LSGYLSLFSGIFVAKEVDGVGDMGSGDTTTAEVQTLLGAILKLSLRSAHFTDEFFSDEKQNFRPWDYSAQMSACQVF
jgi:hypothetical protein